MSLAKYRGLIAGADVQILQKILKILTSHTADVLPNFCTTMSAAPIAKEGNNTAPRVNQLVAVPATMAIVEY